MSGRGGGGGGEEGGGGGPGSQKAGVIQLPIPAHDIAQRGILVAPGRFKVSLEVDGTIVESKTFDVRGDPAAAVTLEQQKAREAFAIEVSDLLVKIEKINSDLTAKKTASTGEVADKLTALQTRLVGGAGGGRGRGGGGGRGGGPQPVRQQLSGIIGAMTISGSQTGTVSPPTGTLHAAFAVAKTELAAIEKELKTVK